MNTDKDLLFDVTFCILIKLYELYKNHEIDYDTFIDHAKTKINFLNDAIIPIAS